MHIWVFSYNRGVFLRNCIASIEQCAPMCTVTVFDDASTDVETLAVLAEVGKRHRVIQPQQAQMTSKHGGLYGNMQVAFEQTLDDDLMLFLQDDTQLVRPIDAQEIVELQQYFIRHPDAAFVQPAFMRGCNEAKDRPLTRFDAAEGMYWVDRYNRSAGAFYSDICIANVQRLRSKGWRFAEREAANEQAAKKQFGQMAYLQNPFAAWLPNVPAFRGKQQTWAMRRAQQVSGSGFFPITIMSSENTQQFKQRDPGLLPYAEQFLSVSNGPIKQPWIYYPLQNKRWLKRISHVEVFLKTQFGRRTK